MRCPIYFEQLSDDDDREVVVMRLVKLEGEHVSYEDCLGGWLALQDSCPKCRRRVKVAGGRDAREEFESVGSLDVRKSSGVGKCIDETWNRTCI